MRFQTLRTVGRWKILAFVDDAGACEVVDALKALRADPKTKATAAGFVVLWDKISGYGPKSLGIDKYHRVDDKHEINEFIKGAHRLFCFESGDCLVVCSHLVRKKSQKTASADRKRAATLRARFLQALNAGNIEILDGD